MIHIALSNLVPGARFIVDDTYESIVWKDDSYTLPSKEVVMAEVARLEAQYIRNQYQRLRAPEYPTMQEQLDMQYWDAINGTTTWQDAIDAVKAKYPKPTES
jgi:hypothetical protein